MSESRGVDGRGRGREGQKVFTQSRKSKEKEMDVEFVEVVDDVFTTSKKATVEVTVKVKKRHHQPSSRHRDPQPQPREGDRDHYHHHRHKPTRAGDVFPKGSWGDLLQKNKARDGKDVNKKDKGKDKVDGVQEKLKCCESGGDHPKSLCHKIPISSDLYLETHTHVHQSDKTPAKTVTRTSTPRGEREQQEQVVEPKKILKTKGEYRALNEEILRRENEALRKQAADLLAEMEKSKLEQQESIVTIKELYRLAELLKLENQKLIGAQEEQHELQQKLISAASENQELKHYLQSIMKIQKDTSAKKDVETNQLERLRHVIQEVKSTIQEEIKGIATSDSASLAYRESLRGLDFNNITQDNSSLLNDTDASEIQRILGSYEDSHVNSLQSMDAMK